MPLNGYIGDSFHFRSNVEYKMSSKMASPEISEINEIRKQQWQSQSECRVVLWNQIGEQFPNI